MVVVVPHLHSPTTCQETPPNGPDGEIERQLLGRVVMLQSRNGSQNTSVVACITHIYIFSGFTCLSSTLVEWNNQPVLIAFCKWNCQCGICGIYLVWNKTSESIVYKLTELFGNNVVNHLASAHWKEPLGISNDVLSKTGELDTRAYASMFMQGMAHITLCDGMT